MKQPIRAIKKSFRLVWEVDKVYPCLLLLKNLLSALLPLYLSICISSLITELAGEGRGGYLTGILLLLAGGAALGKLTGATLEWVCSARYMKIQDAFTAKSSRKAMRMEFAATEDTEIQDLYVHAWQANLAAGTILEQVVSMLGLFLQIAGCIGILWGLEPFLLALLLGFLVLFDWLEYQRSIWERGYAEESVPLLRAAEYTRQCMGELSYAKDVRLYYPESFLVNKLQQVQGERLAKERKKEGRCSRRQNSDWLCFLNRFFRYNFFSGCAEAFGSLESDIKKRGIFRIPGTLLEPSGAGFRQEGSSKGKGAGDVGISACLVSLSRDRRVCLKGYSGCVKKVGDYDACWRKRLWKDDLCKTSAASLPPDEGRNFVQWNSGGAIYRGGADKTDPRGAAALGEASWLSQGLGSGCRKGL